MESFDPMRSAINILSAAGLAIASYFIGLEAGYKDGYKDAGRADEVIIAACEADLSRNQTCKLIAVVDEGEI